MTAPRDDAALLKAVRPPVFAIIAHVHPSKSNLASLVATALARLSADERENGK